MEMNGQKPGDDRFTAIIVWIAVFGCMTASIAVPFLVTMVLPLGLRGRFSSSTVFSPLGGGTMKLGH